jgi:hypothetical protein
VQQVLKLEVDDDEDLETETLQIILWDKDKVTADNIIGNVVCDLHPLLSRCAAEMEGWFPVLDSLRGLCGMLRAVVKMTLLIDHNPREVHAWHVTNRLPSSAKPSPGQRRPYALDDVAVPARWRAPAPHRRPRVPSHPQQQHRF